MDFLFSFIEGILTFISPCILPLLPVYFFYLAGKASGDEASALPGKNKLVINSIAFVAGFTIVFTALGATATALGSFLLSHKNILSLLSGFVMIIFGLNFMGVFKIGFLNTEKRFEFKFKKLGFLSSLLFGIVFGFGWTPCLGAFLGAALLAASNSGTLMKGIMLLFVYSLGLGVPFIISAVVFERAKSALRQIQKYNRVISIISGVFLILAGLKLAYDGFIRYF
jgi:cytochrome c-type biogenesis protein